jgi:hypothetical protein
MATVIFCQNVVSLIVKECWHLCCGTAPCGEYLVGLHFPVLRVVTVFLSADGVVTDGNDSRPSSGHWNLQVNISILVQYILLCQVISVATRFQTFRLFVFGWWRWQLFQTIGLYLLWRERTTKAAWTDLRILTDYLQSCGNTVERRLSGAQLSVEWIIRGFRLCLRPFSFRGDVTAIR